MEVNHVHEWFVYIKILRKAIAYLKGQIRLLLAVTIITPKLLCEI